MHKRYPEDTLEETHIEALKWIRSIVRMATFKVIDRYSFQLIEELIDRFHFGKYKENLFEIPVIVKRILSDK
jgi:hypothetical protein